MFIPRICESSILIPVLGYRKPLARRTPLPPHSLLCQLQPLKMAIEVPPFLIPATATTTRHRATPWRPNAQIVFPVSPASREYQPSVPPIPTLVQQPLGLPSQGRFQATSTRMAIPSTLRKCLPSAQPLRPARLVDVLQLGQAAVRKAKRMQMMMR